MACVDHRMVHTEERMRAQCNGEWVYLQMGVSRAADPLVSLAMFAEGAEEGGGVGKVGG